MGTWGKDDRMDLCDINNDSVISNANCVAAICLVDDLVDTGDGSIELRVKNYGRLYNLCGCEPFNYQPVSAGLMSTGFLVKEDIIATSAVCVDRNFDRIRFVFGYRMADLYTPITRIPVDNVYKAASIVEKTYTSRTPNGTDYALVKLDRKVKGQAVAELSTTNIFLGQPVYVIGHPVGLPLKFAPGANIKSITETSFYAELDIYSGNSGSPVFDADNHKVIGIVVQGDGRDFTWTGKCFVSVVYPHSDANSPGSRCTRFTEFSRYLI